MYNSREFELFDDISAYYELVEEELILEIYKE